MGHFDHGFQLNQDTFFRLDLGRRLRHPGASLLHIRLQFLAGGSAVALEIFVQRSFLLSLICNSLCHLLQKIHHAPDGIHLVPHLHRTNSSDKLTRARNMNADLPIIIATVSTCHCFVCSDKKPEHEVAKGRNNKMDKKEHDVIQVLLEVQVEIPNVLRDTAESHA